MRRNIVIDHIRKSYKSFGGLPSIHGADKRIGITRGTKYIIQSSRCHREQYIPVSRDIDYHTSSHRYRGVGPCRMQVRVNNSPNTRQPCKSTLTPVKYSLI